MKTIHKIIKSLIAVVVSFTLISITNTQAQETSEDTLNTYKIEFFDMDTKKSLELAEYSSLSVSYVMDGIPVQIGPGHISNPTTSIDISFKKEKEIYNITLSDVSGYYQKTVYFSNDKEDSTANSPEDHMKVNYDLKTIKIGLEKNPGPANSRFQVYYHADNPDPTTYLSVVKYTINDIANINDNKYVLSNVNLSVKYGKASKYFKLVPNTTEKPNPVIVYDPMQGGTINIYYESSIPVTFIDDDGNEIEKQNVIYGQDASAPAPDKILPVEGKIFDGWDKDFTNVTSELVVNAKYKDKTYSVEFKDVNGNSLGTQTIVHGKDATAPTAPVIIGKVFTGWDKAFTNVTGDLVVTAQYTDQTYSVEFKDANGNSLGTQTIVHGKDAKAPTAPEIIGKVFTGWDKTFTNVTGNLVVTAQYTDQTYSVEFKDANGNSLGTQTIVHGKDATAPTAPEIIGKVFTGWDKTFTNVTGNLVVTAQYTDQTYSVEFKDADGATLDTQTIVHGSDATAPAAPEIIGKVFTGWDKAFTNITGNLVVTAQYTDQTYSVEFKDANGNSLGSQTIVHGKDATAPTAPEITGKVFAGWDKTFTNVKGDLVVTAQYTDQTYSVEFKDANGNSLGTQTIVHGSGATAPTPPQIDGKKFVGWDKDFSSVKDNMVVVAVYETIETPVAPVVPDEPEQPSTPDTPITVAPVYRPIVNANPVVNETIEEEETPPVVETTKQRKSGPNYKLQPKEGTTVPSLENLGEGETPLASANRHDPNCIIHIIMLILTIIYSIYMGIRVVLRRKEDEEDEEEYEAQASVN